MTRIVADLADLCNKFSNLVSKLFFTSTLYL